MRVMTRTAMVLILPMTSAACSEQKSSLSTTTGIPQALVVPQSFDVVSGFEALQGSRRQQASPEITEESN
jgi:hypothetical protein